MGKRKKTIQQELEEIQASQEIVSYQVAYYEKLFEGEFECVDEMFFPPDKKDLVNRYLDCDKFKVFINYADGISVEL